MPAGPPAGWLETIAVLRSGGRTCPPPRLDHTQLRGCTCRRGAGQAAGSDCLSKSSATDNRKLDAYESIKHLQPRPTIVSPRSDGFASLARKLARGPPRTRPHRHRNSTRASSPAAGWRERLSSKEPGRQQSEPAEVALVCWRRRAGARGTARDIARRRYAGRASDEALTGATRAEPPGVGLTASAGSRAERSLVGQRSLTR